MQIPHGTVVALVDGLKFRLFRNAGNEAYPKLSEMPTPELDKHIDEDACAAAVADWLNAEVLGHRIDLLVVVAPPRTMGELRKHYHAETEEALVLEIPKEMLGREGLELLDVLQDR